LLLRKIINTVAIRFQILTLKCTNFDFGWGSGAPDSAGEVTVFPHVPSWNKGDLLLTEWEECREGKEGMVGEERERKGRGGKWSGETHMCL